MNFNDIPQLTSAGGWECTFSLDGLVRQVDEWCRLEALELNQDFQRGHVWTEAQQSAFVEYVLRGGTSGLVIYLNNPNWRSTVVERNADFVCVDGLQRLTAVQRFVNNDVRAFGLLRSEFTGNIRVCQSMRVNINTLPTRADVLRWYLEMNFGGTPHDPAELARVQALLDVEVGA